MQSLYLCGFAVVVHKRVFLLALPDLLGLSDLLVLPGLPDLPVLLVLPDLPVL